jgi:hypothetical protein
MLIVGKHRAVAARRPRWCEELAERLIALGACLSSLGFRFENREEAGPQKTAQMRLFAVY